MRLYPKVSEHARCWSESEGTHVPKLMLCRSRSAPLTSKDVVARWPRLAYCVNCYVMGHEGEDALRDYANGYDVSEGTGAEAVSRLGGVLAVLRTATTSRWRTMARTQRSATRRAVAQATGGR